MTRNKETRKTDTIHHSLCLGCNARPVQKSFQLLDYHCLHVGMHVHCTHHISLSLRKHPVEFKPHQISLHHIIFPQDKYYTTLIITYNGISNSGFQTAVYTAKWILDINILTSIHTVHYRKKQKHIENIYREEQQK